MDKYSEPLVDEYGNPLEGDDLEADETDFQRAKRTVMNVENRAWYNSAGLLFAGIAILCLIAFTIAISVWAFGKNPDAINDLQDVVKHWPRLNIGTVPPRQTRFPEFDPYPGQQFHVAIANDDDDRSELDSSSFSDTSVGGGDDDDDSDEADDDEDTGFHDPVLYGHVEVLPRFAKDGSPLDGQFDVSVMARFHGAGGIVNYGATTSNCTNTDILRTVHADSAPITEGSPVGFQGGHVGLGFRDFELTTVAEGTRRHGARPFTLDGDTLVNMYTNSALFPALSLTQKGAPSVTSSEVAVTTAAYVDDDDNCRYAGAVHAASPTHFVWAWKETSDAGGLYQLCRIIAEAPFALQCTVPAAFDAADDVTIRDVVYIEGTNDFAIVYTNDAAGLSVFPVTVDTIGLTETAGATVIIDAAATNTDCMQARAHARATVLTVVYTDNSASIAISAATYTVVAGVVTPDTAAAAIAVPDDATIDVDIMGDYTLVTVVDDSVSAGDRLFLFHQVGSSLPLFVWADAIDIHFEPEDQNPNRFVTVTTVSDDTAVVCHQPREYRSAQACQPWTLDDAVSPAVMIPGDDNIFTRIARSSALCAAYGGLDGSFSCLFTTYATGGNANHVVRSATGVINEPAVAAYGATVKFVNSGPDSLMGIALHDAVAGEPLAVRISGCFDFTNTATRFSDTEVACLHGDGVIRPRMQVATALAYDYAPRCSCKVLSSKVIWCEDMPTKDVRVLNDF